MRYNVHTGQGNDTERLLNHLPLDCTLIAGLASSYIKRRLLRQQSLFGVGLSNQYFEVERQQGLPYVIWKQIRITPAQLMRLLQIADAQVCEGHLGFMKSTD